MQKYSLGSFVGSKAKVLIDGIEIDANRIHIEFQDVEAEISAIKRLIATVVSDSESAIKFFVGVLDEIKSAPAKAVAAVKAEFHVTSVPATLPEHSGTVLRVVSAPVVEPPVAATVEPTPTVADAPANTPTIVG